MQNCSSSSFSSSFFSSFFSPLAEFGGEAGPTSLSSDLPHFEHSCSSFFLSAFELSVLSTTLARSPFIFLSFFPLIVPPPFSFSFFSFLIASLSLSFFFIVPRRLFAALKVILFIFLCGDSSTPALTKSVCSTPDKMSSCRGLVPWRAASAIRGCINIEIASPLFSLSFSQHFVRKSTRLFDQSSGFCSEGAGPSIIRYIALIILLFTCGGSPSTISIRVTPKLQISLKLEACSPCNTSGAIKTGVPTGSSGSFSFFCFAFSISPESIFEIPKSANFTSPLSFKRILAALISQ
mmetsp:Transcript_37300/g.58751  ORF Transcript_37300/g.58751 Transcript_37300/m.58751 type:complete len:293 (-) Transcript_37300:1459-2337(-)